MNTVSEEMSASVVVYEDGEMTGSVQVSAEERKHRSHNVIALMNNKLHVKFSHWMNSSKRQFNNGLMS